MPHVSGTTKELHVPDEVAPGQVILLNGVSSSGKSSIARQLLIDLERPFFHMGVDMIGAMRSQTRTHELDATALTDVLRRTRAGFHRAVAAMALAGNDIVMDHVLTEPWRLRDCLTVFDGIDVVFVGVHCSLDELQRRERERADRTLGTAAEQIESVHAHAIYDLEVDTSTDTAASCSNRIKQFLDQGPSPRAFDQLRATPGTPSSRHAT
ncbi:AAA family ATPase [Nocardia sp. CA2R105]|uniref:chloramphenicol phosphotransferase CPT family protein n=1 Tax=Nocardia coffeae TaxID=2873381 RepID=UPI001CA6277B|nr:AAA family ATPase [Nocardia coffeae]MBY8857669.1 AAA family ATPase [Nocardia coffeae]